jgi:hypothetical protein
VEQTIGIPGKDPRIQHGVAEIIREDISEMQDQGICCGQGRDAKAAHDQGYFVCKR